MKFMRTLFGPALALACTTLLSSSVWAAKPPEYFVDKSKLPFEALANATAYWGVHAEAGYRIEVPDEWNGSLVVWAHGFRGTGLELTVDNHPLRELLISLGYAWAASSYTRNDYDIASGVQSTHALIKYFNGLVDKPSQVLLSGASMGGHITGVLIEQYPQLFDGALPICGVMGDYELFDFFGDYNLAAQQLGVGMSSLPVGDPVVYLFGTVPAIKSNLEAVPGGWPIALNADGTNFKNLVELRSGGDRPNFDEAWIFWNSFPGDTAPGNFLFEVAIGDGSLPRAPGQALDNSDAIYQFDTDPGLSPEEQAFNNDIFRIEREPQTLRKQGLAQVPTITGDIDIPVLTLHNLGDLFVPVLNQVVYAGRVLENGKGDLLVQRAIRGVNHCGFTGPELAQAFLDLARWVDTGIRPLGDDFSDPASIADPSFGCQFTDFETPDGHLLPAACP